MLPEDFYDINLCSERFSLLCSKLNATLYKEDATWTLDVFSGGFKFSDEFPEGLSKPETMELELLLSTLMRSLWAYRISLVEGKSRPDLAATWESAKALAPLWAGFTPDRCSPNMQPIVDRVRSKAAQFAQDVERLEARLCKGKAMQS